MDSVIRADNLVVRYGPRTILDGVSLNVERGRIFGFIGPNGAGKSTFIKTLLGLVFPDSGSIALHGESPSAVSARRKIGYLPEETNYYKFLTPLESLAFYGKLCGLPKNIIAKRSEELLASVGLEDVKSKRVGTFSKGMAQKLSLAQALIHDPETLILDEPTSGLDPLARADLRELLTDLKKKGKTLFFSSHELSEVELLCDGVALIRAGRIAVQGPIKDVLSHSEQNLEKLFVKLIRS